MAQVFNGSGLGSIEDVHACIVPPLRMESKLPFTEENLSESRRAANTMRRQNKWREFTELLHWVHRNSSKRGFEELRELEIELGERFRTATLKADKKTQSPGHRGIIEMLEDLRFALLGATNQGDKNMAEDPRSAGAKGDYYHTGLEFPEAIRTEPNTVTQLLLNVDALGPWSRGLDNAPASPIKEIKATENVRTATLRLPPLSSDTQT
ncbi:MAG: hypothetical protein M1840_006706 [Geoglossum simile]|nr:MAG: hypothetical protein M1840_006706 [Geoglossum simile]